MGFLGILEDKKLAHVPATVLLTDQPSSSLPIDAPSGVALKHGTGKDADIILIPQPSDDPNDPLNWSTAKKLAATLIVALGSILYAAVLGPMFAAAIIVVAKDLGKSLKWANTVTGYLLLVTGASGPFVCAISRKYGKRPLLFFSSCFAILGTALGSGTTGWKGFLAARILQGASVSAFESLGVSMIADLYFLHHRGYFMTVFQFTLGATTNLCSIISGPIATHLGWRYIFHIMVACAVFETFLIFFFVPETNYNRAARFELDEAKGTSETPPNQEAQGTSHLQTTEEKEIGDVHLESVSSSRTYQPKHTFVQEFPLWTGKIYSHESFIHLLAAPFLILTNMSILWFVIVTGGLTACLVSQSFVIAQIFMAPPYRMNPAGVGYLSTGPVVGGVLASLITGASIDPAIKWCARKNKGIYEPEYRLLFMVLALLAGAGLFLFGHATEAKLAPTIAAVAWGINVFGIVNGSISASAYVIDAFRDMSSELFIINCVTKNFIIYAFSTFTNEWTKEDGPQSVFYLFGGLAFGLVCTTPIVFFGGKRYRSMWARWNVLKALGIGTHAEV